MYIFAQAIRETLTKTTENMTTTTLSNRLDKRFKGSKSSFAYKSAKSVIDGERLIRPCHTSGRGRFTSNLDYTSDVMQLLSLLGIKYEIGNDSPRGGKTGNFIKITTKISE